MLQVSLSFSCLGARCSQSKSPSRVEAPQPDEGQQSSSLHDECSGLLLWNLLLALMPLDHIHSTRGEGSSPEGAEIAPSGAARVEALSCCAEGDVRSFSGLE